MKAKNLRPLLWIPVVGIFFYGMSQCYDPSGAESILSKNGYTQIQIGGRSWLGCSKDDFYATKFSAVTPSGSQVEGSVCSGLVFKNTTIRFSE